MRLLGARRPPPVLIETERLLLRPAVLEDHEAWAALRRASEAFLAPWEPRWAPDALSARSFRRRVDWTRRGLAQRSAVPLLVFRLEDDALLGGVTLDNIRKGVSMSGTLGYWIGVDYARCGYMSEAVEGLCAHAFDALTVTRIEAACLPENAASRALLKRCGFAEEGRAPAYLHIDGSWRDHILHARRAPGRVEGAVDARAQRL